VSGETLLVNHSTSVLLGTHFTNQQLVGAFNLRKLKVVRVCGGLLIVLGFFINRQTRAQVPERLDLPINSGQSTYVGDSGLTNNYLLTKRVTSLVN
jgi:hypothetical protein